MSRSLQPLRLLSNPGSFSAAPSSGEEHGLPEVQPHGPESLHPVRPPGHPLRGAKRPGPRPAEHRQAVQLAVQAAGGPALCTAEAGVPGGLSV